MWLNITPNKKVLYVFVLISDRMVDLNLVFLDVFVLLMSSMDLVNMEWCILVSVKKMSWLVFLLRIATNALIDVVSFN